MAELAPLRPCDVHDTVSNSPFFFPLPEKKQELFDWQCALHLMDLKGCVVPTVFYIARETASLQRRAMFFRKKSVLSILGIVDYMHPNNNEFPFL